MPLHKEEMDTEQFVPGKSSVIVSSLFVVVWFSISFPEQSKDTKLTKVSLESFGTIQVMLNDVVFCAITDRFAGRQPSVL